MLIVKFTGMAKKNLEVTDESFMVEQIEESSENITGKEIVDSIMPNGIKDFADNLILKAEAIENFGKTRKGDKIEKRFSILKVLLDKKLIKLI